VNDKHPIILVKSDRKGSNPGGFCAYYDNRHNFEGYFKYCFGSRIPSNYSFLRAEHQPVYEAITFELARKFGLKTPNFFVLMNENNDVEFKDPEKFSPNNHSGRHYYFISEKIHEPPLPNLDTIGSKIIDREKIYLEGLMIEDILGKRQNYLILQRGEDFGVSYLDLGCSFVHAVGGFIKLPNELRNYLRNCDAKRDKCILKKKAIITANNNFLVDLEELVSSFGTLNIPTLNPHSRTPISELVSPEEITEIGSYLVGGLCKSLSHFKEKGLLIQP